jgi:hypothetical protein
MRSNKVYPYDFFRNRPICNISEFWYCKTMSSSIVLPLLADYLMYHLDSTAGPLIRLLSKDYRLAFLFSFNILVL